MADYTEEFLVQFRENKTKDNIVFGFSFGAMIASLTTQQTNPGKLLLCSLSPYFSRDMADFRADWRKKIGERRYQDFFNYDLGEMARNLLKGTTIFYGTKEGELYPSLKKTCEDAARESGSRLVPVKDAPHDISHSNYRKAIMNYLN